VQSLVEQRTQEGHLLVKYKNYDTAIESYKQAAKLNPDDKNLYYHLASAYRGAGRNAEAHEYYKKCLDSATYGGTCRDGLKKTEKAAREAAKRGQSVQKPGEEE
jgi:tetratricopeptide (TPR) repeat protein